MIDDIKQAVLDFKLDLTDCVVLTEAATGSYSSTPIIAAIAGAKKVYCFCKDNPYATTEEMKSIFKPVIAQYPSIRLVTELDSVEFEKRMIVTNSGNLRPINENIISRLHNDSIISLMYESWERRDQDIDIELCSQRKIDIVAPFEFNDFVGFNSTIIKMIEFGLDKIESSTNKIGFVSNNKFGEILSKKCPSWVKISSSDDLLECETIVLCRTAKKEDDYEDLDFTKVNKDSKVIQVWGNLNRSRLGKTIQVFPTLSPRPGHMGILPSDIGDTPVIRLQTAGLKIAQCYLTKDLNFSKYGNYVLKN